MTDHLSEPWQQKFLFNLKDEKKLAYLLQLDNPVIYEPGDGQTDLLVSIIMPSRDEPVELVKSDSHDSTEVIFKRYNQDNPWHGMAYVVTSREVKWHADKTPEDDDVSSVTDAYILRESRSNLFDVNGLDLTIRQYDFPDNNCSYLEFYAPDVSMASNFKKTDPKKEAREKLAEDMENGEAFLTVTELIEEISHAADIDLAECGEYAVKYQELLKEKGLFESKEELTLRIQNYRHTNHEKMMAFMDAAILIGAIEPVKQMPCLMMQQP